MRMDEYLIGYTPINMVKSQEKSNVCNYRPRKRIWIYRDTKKNDYCRVLNKNWNGGENINAIANIYMHNLNNYAISSSAMFTNIHSKQNTNNDKKTR